jgi:hypothetical protein
MWSNVAIGIVNIYLSVLGSYYHITVRCRVRSINILFIGSEILPFFFFFVDLYECFPIWMHDTFVLCLDFHVLEYLHFTHTRDESPILSYRIPDSKLTPRV